MNKSQAGQLGGLSTFKKYGKNHMRKIGKQGGIATWERHYLAPVGTSYYAMVRKSDNIIVKVIWRTP